MKRAQVVILTALTLLVMAIPALAVEGGETASHLPWMDFLFRVINFALVIGIIWKFAGKQIGEFFRGRRHQIKSELDDLDTRRKAAEARLRQVEKSISGIESERESILAEYKAQGEALRNSILEEAEKKAALIGKQAEAQVSQQTQLAIQGLRAQMADMVVDTAEKILKEKLGESEHQKLVDEYLTKVVLN